MTVQELIDELIKVGDKSKEIEIYTISGTNYEEVVHVVEYSNSVVIS